MKKLIFVFIALFIVSNVANAATILPVPACASGPTMFTQECINQVLAVQKANQAARDEEQRQILLKNCNDAWAANDARFAQLGLPRPSNGCAAIYSSSVPLPGNSAGSPGQTGQTINSGVTLPAQFSGNVTLQNSTNLINSLLGQITSVCTALSSSNNSSISLSIQNSLCSSNSTFTNLIKNAYNQQISSFSSVVSGSYGGSAPVSGTGDLRTVTVSILNVRTAPITTAPTTGSFAYGSQFSASCYVIGETVSGNDRWWKAPTGTYLWSGGTGGTGSAPLCSGSTTPLPPSNPIDNQKIGLFQFLKLTITEPGPISIREIEVYNLSGTKLKVVSTTASNNSTQATNVNDDNPDTVWNAGTNSAWITIDLGDCVGSCAKDVSRIKILSGNDSSSGTIDVKIGWNDGSFASLGSYPFFFSPINVKADTSVPLVISGPFTDRQYVQYPPVSYSADPTVSFTVNGQKSKDVSRSAGVNGEKIIYAWTTTKADYVTITGSFVKDPAVTSTLSSDDQRICDVLNNGLITDTLKTAGWIMPLNGSAEGLQYFSGCGNYLFTYTITVGQRYSGKTVTDKVTVRLLP